MLRIGSNGENLEFSKSVKRKAFFLNQQNSPPGCVGYYCEWCWFSNPQERFFQVDHIIPASRMVEFGLTVEELISIENACILCEACNRSKLNFGTPRHGSGLAFHAPNLNMTHGERRRQPLDWDDLIRWAQRKGPFQRRS